MVADAESDVDDVDDHRTKTCKQTADVEAGDMLKVVVDVYQVANEE